MAWHAYCHQCRDYSVPGEDWKGACQTAEKHRALYKHEVKVLQGKDLPICLQKPPEISTLPGPTYSYTSFKWWLRPRKRT